METNISTPAVVLILLLQRRPSSNLLTGLQFGHLPFDT